eukprot:3230949-Amphidinium_carterae.1
MELKPLGFRPHMVIGLRVHTTRHADVESQEPAPAQTPRTDRAIASKVTSKTIKISTRIHQHVVSSPEYSNTKRDVNPHFSLRVSHPAKILYKLWKVEPGQDSTIATTPIWSPHTPHQENILVPTCSKTARNMSKE